jgi:ABC-2 type transport system ATP-binding protein
VALDSIRNLTNSISGCTVRLRLMSEVLPVSLQPLLNYHEDGCHFLALEDYAQVEDVLAALRAVRTQVVEMQVLQPDLEEVFMKIMNTAQALESPATAR